MTIKTTKIRKTKSKKTKIKKFAAGAVGLPIAAALAAGAPQWKFYCEANLPPGAHCDLNDTAEMLRTLTVASSATQWGPDGVMVFQNTTGGAKTKAGMSETRTYEITPSYPVIYPT